MSEAASFWLWAIGLTTMAEVLVWKMMVKCTWAEGLLATLVINATTVPVANFGYAWALGRLGSEPLAFVAVEIGVILTEVWLVRVLVPSSWPWAVAVATAANVASGALSMR